MTTKTFFGRLADGRDVNLFKIENSFGEYAEICDYGAVIQSLVVLDRDGRLGDTVLACPTVNEMQGKSFKAATIGRCANRIAYGKCVLDGRELSLDINDRGVNFIHGGAGNWAFRLFEGSINPDGSVSFTYTDRGEGGFGTTAEVKVTFSFGDDHRLAIHYEVLSVDGTTILSPTNHAYFNLGDFEDIRDEEFTLYSANRALLGPSRTPEGGLDPVAGTAYEFRGKAVGEMMKLLPEGVKGFDDFFVLDRQREDKLVAVLYSPKTGRVMNTYTDMQSAIIYTPVNCTSRPDKSGKVTCDYSAICIETQFVPNAVNCPEFDQPVFRAGEKLDTTTVYEFSVR